MRLLLLYLLLAPLSLSAQIDYSPKEQSQENENASEVSGVIEHKFGLTVVPLSLLDPSMPAIQAGIDFRFKAFQSINLDVGIQPGIIGFNVSGRENSSGIKGRLQWRHFAKKNGFRALYTGLEALYKFQQFDHEVVLGHECSNATESQICIFYEQGSITVRQHAQALGVVFGVQTQPPSVGRSRFLLDISTSLGVRVITENYDTPPDLEIFPTTGQLARFRSFESPSFFIYPNVGFTLRLGWWF